MAFKRFVSLFTGHINHGIENNINRRFASNYKAAVLKNLNEPLSIEELQQKKLKIGQVRIKVHACSVNSSDYLLTQGANPGKFPLPIVPGYEVSGTVLETQGCTEIAKGDKVVALSKSTLGGFAEECIVDEKDAWILSGGLDFKIAAALPDSFGTAMLGLVHRGHLSEKQTVLVTMAAAHGFAALDLAANVYKAKVIAVCMSDEETSNLRKRGAWMATSFSEKEILHDVKELTKDVGLNVIYDTLGGEVLHTCMKCISHEGHIIIAGYTLSELPRVRISELLALPCFSLSGVSLTSYRKHDFPIYRKAVDDALDMKEQGLISPVISATFPLQEVNKAIELIKEKQPLGKVVLEIA